MKKLVLILLIAICSQNIWAQNDVDVFLIARNTGEKVLASGDTIRVFGFAPDLGTHPPIPGPTIYANEGDSVHIDLWNVSQGAPHTIHLHGLDVDQQNDGVPHLSFEVEHMDHGFYHFKAPHAGTYLYHCHVASPIHVQAGMYGLVIIRPSNGEQTTWNGGYYFHHELSLMMSEIDTVWHNDTILEHDHVDTLMVTPVKLPKYEPQFFLVNGLSDQQLDHDSTKFYTEVGSRNYVRLTNIGFYGNRVIFPAGMTTEIIDSDGRPLPAKELSDTVYVYPGERYGVLAEALNEFTDSIKVEYFDLNTQTVRGTQYIGWNVNGTNTISEEKVISDFEITPNPSREYIGIKYAFDPNSEYSIIIHSLDGRIVMIKNINGLNSSRVNLESISTGTYNISLIENGNVINSKNLIKQ